MRNILLALIITLAAQSKAQELQLCGGNTYKDGFKGEPILPNETELDYATRIGLESEQFSSKTSDANDLINCQEKMPLPKVILTEDTIQYDILEVPDDVGLGRLRLTYDQMLALRPEIVKADNEKRAQARLANGVPDWMLDNPDYDRSLQPPPVRTRYTNPVTGEAYFGNGSRQYILNPNLKGPYLPDGSLIPNERKTIAGTTVGEGWTGGNYGSGTFGSYTDGIAGTVSFSRFLKGNNRITPNPLNPEALFYIQPSNVFTGDRSDPANYTPAGIAARMEGAQQAYLIAYPPPTGDATAKIYVQGTAVVAPYKPDYFVDSSIWTPLQYKKPHR